MSQSFYGGGGGGGSYFAPTGTGSTTGTFVSTAGPECEAHNFSVAGGAGSTAVVAQNRIYLAPVRIETPRTFVEMGWHNGTTSNGNLAAGIYTLAGARLDYTAHTAQGNVSEAQSAALVLANVLLQPGLYYFAIGSDSATAHLFRNLTNVNLLRVWGFAEASSAYANPMPATVTPAWPLTSNSMPYVWASTVAVQ